MTMSKRTKFGLALMVLAIVSMLYSYSMFNDAKESASEDDVAVDNQCVGHLDTLFDPYCWSVVPSGDFGLGACCTAICSLILAAGLLLGGWVSFLFGLGKKKEEGVDFVPAPMVESSEDEFADLERELDSLED